MVKASEKRLKVAVSGKQRVSQIYGEYAKVSRRTKNYDLLEMLHSTPCTQSEAIAMIESIAKQYGISVSAIRFREGSRGRAYYKKFSITLPATPGSGFGRLRIGIVLHEIAHLIACKRGEKAHRQVFVDVLDTLTDEWFINNDELLSGTYPKANLTDSALFSEGN